MSDNATLSPEVEALIKQAVAESVREMKAELLVYIDQQLALESSPTQEESIEPLTLNMVMLQIAAIFEKFGHYDEIYRTYGIEADAFQDECNEAIDVMHYQLEQFASQLREFQNRLHIEESGGDAAIQINIDIQQRFDALSKEIHETLNQFDQYFDSQLKELEGLSAEIVQLRSDMTEKISRSESIVRVQEAKADLIGKLKAAVDSINKQLPTVVERVVERRLK